MVRERKTRVKKSRNRWLELIATYKLLQALLLVAVGVGALRLIHKDLADMLTNLAIALASTEFKQFFGWPNLIYLYLTLAGMKVLHELGHGLTCRHFGGECHEIGMLKVSAKRVIKRP